MHVRRKKIKFKFKFSFKKKDVGVGGYVGNKGAVGCRFKFYDTTMCFICMHLVPGQNAFLKRNQNLSDIFDLIKFEKYPLKKHE